MEEIIYFSYNEKSSSLLIFFINSLIFSGLLLTHGLTNKNKSDFWLASFVFLGGLYLCPFMLGYAGWYGKQVYREILFFIPFQQLFLLGPVFYYYVRNLLETDLKYSQLDLLHFLPSIVYLLFSAIVFITDKLVLKDFYFYADGKDMDLDFWYQFSGVISMSFYLFLSLKRYLQYRNYALQEFSFADEVAFKWLKYFIISFIILIALRIILFISNPEWGNFGSKYWYYICFSILLLIIAIKGYSNVVRLSQLAINPSNFNFINESNDQSNGEILNDTEITNWKQIILNEIQLNEAYKDHNLTLLTFAGIIGTNRNILSKVINFGFGKNFNDFINEFRVQSVIDAFEKGEHKNSTLEGLCYEHGFSSKSTFNRAFKKLTGFTPIEYLEYNNLK